MSSSTTKNSPKTSSGDPVQFSVPTRSSAVKRKKLGKGLGALLGETKREEPLTKGNNTASAPTAEHAQLTPTVESGEGVASLPVALIEPLPGQPRKHFDEAALDELAASIAARGVIQPIIVRPLAKGRFQLVAGERRWRAAQRARLHEIPALVRELDHREVMALALIENIQREDLNAIEEAQAYQRFIDDGMTQAEIGRLVDKSRSHVANLMRLLVLPDDVQALVGEGALSMGHARALIGNDDATALAKRAVKQKLSVRDIEKLVKAPKKAGANGKSSSALSSETSRDADIVAVQSHLEEFLGLPVKIKAEADPRSGAVTIQYRTLDQLDLICQRLTGGDI